MRVWIELFLVALDGPEVRYRRSLLDATGLARDPDELVAEHLACPGAEAPEPALVHSTSWRYEPDGSLVLTYLALVCCAAGAENWSSCKDLGVVELPPSQAPQRPRPAEIRQEHVLSHGLRHLAFLEQERGSVGFCLGAAAGVLLGLPPAPAGKIG
jgi:hypothetical protein